MAILAIIALSLISVILFGVCIALRWSLLYLESRVLMFSNNEIDIDELLEEAERIKEERDYD